MSNFTREQVEARIEGLPLDAAKAVVCALVGHSRVQNVWFGYWDCARCGQRVGDTLASRYDASEAVALDHHCDDCRRVAKTLEWTDTLLLSDEQLAYISALADEEQSKITQADNAAKRETALASLRQGKE